MTNLRTAAICLIITLFSIPSIAQNAGNGNALLWRISGNGLEKPSYLFAAMDLICPDDYLWTKSMQDCFAKCDVACFNMDLSDPDLKNKLMAGIKSTDGKQMKDYFTSLNYPVVVTYARENLHINMEKFQSFKPLAIQSALVAKLLGCPAPVAYEKRICEEAQKAGKKVLGLKTVAEVMNDVDAIQFNKKIADVLTEMANGSDYYHKYRTDIMNAYQKQDIQRVNAIFKTARSWTGADFKVMLADNNKTWVSRMPAMMQHSSVFFALTAMNIGGDDGVLNLLKKAGYTVEPVY